MTGNKRVIHLCLPADDNLGDTLAHQAISRDLDALGRALEFEQVDIGKLQQQGKGLDDSLDAINSNFDLMVIGAGGLLSLFLINAIFTNPDSWRRLKIPIVFYGVGILGNYGYSQWVMSGQNTAGLEAALSSASLIGVRDLKTWLVASKYAESTKIQLTGCPTIQYAAGPEQDKKYNIALNLPFQHGMCRNYQRELFKIAHTVRNVDGLVWVCHSEIERLNAEELRDQLQAGYAVEVPGDFDQVRQIYSRCNLALVTKAHAAIFCLANNVPFGFLSYDLKCDALMDMIVDFPCDYLVHIHELGSIDIPTKIGNILSSLQRDKRNIQLAQKSLLKKFSSERRAFLEALGEII